MITYEEKNINGIDVVKIHGAKNVDEGQRAEHAYILKKFGKLDKNYKSLTLWLVMRSKMEIAEITFLDGKVKQLQFDISNFF